MSDVRTIEVSSGVRLRIERHPIMEEGATYSRSNEVINYHVDVISEKYLPSYLNIIDREMLTIKKLLQKYKKDVYFSIHKIIKECRSLKKPPKTYRKYLEFDSYR